MDPKALIAQVSPENRVVVPRASWELYDDVLRELDERHVVVTFTGRRLELMLPSYRHRRAAELLGILVRLLADITGMPIAGAGATTLRRQDLRKGIEPGNAFYLRNARRMVGKEDLDLGVDPPPDLAVEIEISRRAVDRMHVYATIGVPEVWRYDGKILVVEFLRTDGNYERCARSPSFRQVPLFEIHRYLKRGLEECDESTWIRAAREWLTLVYGPLKSRSAQTLT